MSQGMNTLLGDVFGTGGTAVPHTDEDFTKQANLEFFSALCQSEGIDVKELDDATVESLFKTAMEMQKQAAEEGAPPFPPKKDEKKGDKDEDKDDGKEKEAQDSRTKLAAAANAEYLEKRAARVKVAEADYMGRVMAHAMVDELGKIKEAMESKAAGEFPFPPKKDDKDKDEKKDAKDEGKDEGKEKDSSASKATALIAAMARSKTASAPSAAPSASTTTNLDELAAYHAIDLLKEAGVDPEIAFKRVDAAYTLGLQESTKVAAAETGEIALQVRALEICEAAGFQVNWRTA